MAMLHPRLGDEPFYGQVRHPGLSITEAFDLAPVRWVIYGLLSPDALTQMNGNGRRHTAVKPYVASASASASALEPGAQAS